MVFLSLCVLVFPNKVFFSTLLVFNEKSWSKYKIYIKYCKKFPIYLDISRKFLSGNCSTVVISLYYDLSLATPPPPVNVFIGRGSWRYEKLF